MSPRREEIVNIIKGWRDMKESDGSYKPIIDIYNSIVPLPENYRLKYTDAWGPATVSAVYQQAGLAHLFSCECSCTRMLVAAKEKGIWVEDDKYRPRPADVCLLDFQDTGDGENEYGVPTVAGLVISVDKASKTFMIMEGNRDRAISCRTLSFNSRYIRGFIAPQLDDPAETPEKPPTATVIVPNPDQTTIVQPTVLGTGTLSKIAAGTLMQLQDTPIYASPKTQVNSGFKSGKYYIWSVDTVNSRVRITNTRSNVGVTGQVTGWIDVSDALATMVESPEGTVTADTPRYLPDAVYVVQVDELPIRKGPGTGYDQLTYGELTPNARKYDTNKNGCLHRGCKVTCLRTQIVGINVWMEIPSGWVQAYYNKKYFVK